MGVKRGHARAAQEDHDKKDGIRRREAQAGDADARKSRRENGEMAGVEAVCQVPVNGLGNGAGEREGAAENAGLREAEAEVRDQQRLQDAEGARVKIDPEVREAEQQIRGKSISLRLRNKFCLRYLFFS